MKRCLQLAKHGAGEVAPNPMVGAVLVYENRVIGEGYHQQYGGPHAEVNCFNSVLPSEKDLISKATMYVSLEPCAHFGKTPPCADLIIKHQVKMVIIGSKDPFQLVAGKGIQKLTDAGVEVTTGILNHDCLQLNRRFFTFHQKQRPYIILKWAQSNDKKISASTKERTIISNEFSNRLQHKWRSREAAIMVGTNTALLDNPMLSTRLWPGKNPLRIVIDMDLKLPVSLHLFDGSTKTIVFNRLKHSQANNLLYYKIDSTKNIVSQIMNALYSLQVLSLIVEGGQALLQSFIEEDLWDEARVITNTTLNIGQGLSSPILLNSTLFYETQLANDRISFYKNNANLYL